MSPLFVFLFTLLGAAGVQGLRRLEKRRERKLKIAVWAAALVWYLVVATGFAFTLVNLQGLHSRAALTGGAGTLIAAALIGLAVYRLVNPQTGRNAS